MSRLEKLRERIEKDRRLAGIGASRYRPDRLVERELGELHALIDLVEAQHKALVDIWADPFAYHAFDRARALYDEFNGG